MVATLAVTAMRSGRFEAPLLRVSVSVFTILTFLFLVGVKAQGVRRGSEFSCTMSIGRLAVVAIRRWIPR